MLDIVTPPEFDAAIFPVDRVNTNAIPALTGLPVRTPGFAFPATHVVTSPLDSGPGTLRQNLLDAKAGDTISFDPSVFPPINPITIFLASELPQVTQGYLTIDASNAGVILDGNNTPPGTTGLRLNSDGNAVKGLQILHFPGNGITIGNASYNRIGGDRTKGIGPLGEGNLLSSNGVGGNACGVHIGGRDAPTIRNTVSGNLIGTDLSGTVALGNANGVYLAGWANYNVIGGATAGERNIISGNGIGVMIHQTGANGNVVAGNYIGTDISGAHPLGNSEYGVFIVDGPDGNIVGGMEPGEGNLISGNPTGVMIAGSDANHNAVIGNLIGTDASGTSALGNQTGISLYTGTFSRIERNLISGNLGSGILLGDWNSLILGNLIGTDISGTQTLGNGVGISLSGQHILVGGTTSLERNTIADNHVGIDANTAGTEYNWIAGNAIGTNATGTLLLGNRDMGVRMRDYAAHNFIQNNTIAFNRGEWWKVGGVYVERSPYNSIRRNSIYSNVGMGIVLSEGGNQMLPAPLITSITENSVSGTTCSGCTVEVFSDAEDEGRVYEGSAIANAAGVFTFSKGTQLTGPHVTATATDRDGNTSEFSTAQIVWRLIYLPVIVKGQ
jgi:titin